MLHRRPLLRIANEVELAQETHVLLGDEAALARDGILGDEPALAVAVGDEDDLALDEGELVLVFAGKVEEGDGFAVHFLVGRGDGKLVVARVAGFFAGAGGGERGVVVRVRGVVGAEVGAEGLGGVGTRAAGCGGLWR